MKLPFRARGAHEILLSVIIRDDLITKLMQPVKSACVRARSRAHKFAESQTGAAIDDEIPGDASDTHPVKRVYSENDRR